MYYSYKIVISESETIKTFNTNFTFKPVGEDMVQNERYMEELQQQKASCRYLGSVDGLHYYYVPDDYPLTEQDPEIEATPLETLDHEVREKLILSSDSIVSNEDYAASAVMMPNKTSAADQQNWAYLYSLIRGLAYKVYLLLAQTPVTLSSEAVSSVFASNILNKLVEEEIKKQNAVNVITDFEVSKRNKLKELDLITAKFEDNINKAMHFTSSLGFRCNGDRRTATNLAGLITAYDLPPNNGALVEYRDYDNNVQNLNKEQLQTLYTEHLTNGNMLYQQKWEKEAEINAAETLDALNSVDLTFKMQDYTQTALAEVSLQSTTETTPVATKKVSTLKSLLNL